MAGIETDSEAMRQFGARLGHFKEQLNDNLQRTGGQMAALGETWRDEQYQEFQAVFSRTYPLMKRFIEEAERTIPKLNADADAIDEYAALRPE